MSPFVAHVPLRWTDQDAYQHLNNGAVVTLLEEARIGLFFNAAAEHGLDGFAPGLLVAALHVDYRRQLPYRAEPVLVEMTVDEVRAASFRVGYRLHDGTAATDPVAVTAWTKMATFDLAAGRPRRLTEPERAFLARWVPEPA